MDISSLVVDARPDALQAVRAALAALAGVEIHAATDRGTLIVTIETADVEQASAIVERIGAMAGVLSVTLVYHQYEPDPKQEAPDGTEPT